MNVSLSIQALENYSNISQSQLYVTMLREDSSELRIIKMLVK